ncbi:UTP--GlnB (protein PII) uridylyltransferase, GlnD [Rubritalea squalenifaciens DSM 18772]|uniref:Bifunctional uridylyltransferase/uridylyl-removing enzyme n=1 Tax=Rubritalea squalenifaciens DSM 18772 TaxID=1123071 RepID=A0A1M6MIC9_9BACT|nr:[protein-PII] uridylyltransferase [Rubritalea squalenifaciens]SHJ83184.1 UTP--GlnB (protein PII) uridylyltransferase, GlnD [Rubritalea squalenifaciens DSM 18772]
MQELLTKIREKAEAELLPVLMSDVPQAERAAAAKEFISETDELIRAKHVEGAGGLEVAGARSTMIDVVLESAFTAASNRCTGKLPGIALNAVGGYGRGQLNPGSDIDLLFLLSIPSHKLNACAKAFIQEILYLLWDSGIKVGHASRSINECLTEARSEQQSKTALMDTRLLAGDDVLYEDFKRRFQRDCIQKNPEDFFELRRQDINSRHRKYSHTVFLQEPHVKESCGGLRDYHNILWVSQAERGTSELEALVRERILTKRAYKELQEGYDFLHRVRNELHYHTGKSTDILTLQLQGVVATNFQYPEKSILRRCESFMRDYYRHTRNIYNHTTSLMEIFQLELDENENKGGWLRFLPKPKAKREEFDCFISRKGFIYPKNQDIFEDNPHMLMLMFQHTQLKNIKLSPQMRKLVKANWKLIDKEFRANKQNRETFRAMLERKGQVASVLRRMHRVGFLGRFMPEFGALDCLVQHEFFHRYTADEHTLRCIDQLDALIEDERPEREIYRRLLTDAPDPYALYIALILHDTGRAENVREHIDGSAILADRVCTRLNIKGSRRSLISFLVDHHLTFWRFATNRNLDDPAVIEEFASIMRDKERLSTLLLFTYADSNGTNEEAWSPWKESLMLQLYHSTLSFMEKGKEKYQAVLTEEISALKDETRSLLKEKYHEQLEHHFERMPRNYFRYRNSQNLAIHIRAVRRFLRRHEDNPERIQTDLRWISREDRAYTELIVTTWNKSYLIEKVSCALAANEINIIAADVYTRTDNIVCDIFHVCTVDHKPVTDSKTKKKVKEVFDQLMQQEDYDSSLYLKRKRNFLRKDKNEGALPFPVRAFVNQHLSSKYTAIEIQALDRIGLLHDLFLHIGKCGLATVHARICTEKGAAMDTIYVSNLDGTKVTDPEKLRELETTIQALVGFDNRD